MQRPTQADHHPYFQRYVGRVPEGDILELLSAGLETSRALLRRVDEERSEYRYAPGKWSVKELWGHVLDSERIFGVRCLAIIRGETYAYPPFDEDAYVKTARFERRSLADLFAEFEHLRRSHLHLFASMDDEEGARLGWSFGAPIRARSVPWILAGHEIHHREILKERYGLREG